MLKERSFFKRGLFIGCFRTLIKIVINHESHLTYFWVKNEQKIAFFDENLMFFVKLGVFGDFSCVNILSKRPYFKHKASQNIEICQKSIF